MDQAHNCGTLLGFEDAVVKGAEGGLDEDEGDDGKADELVGGVVGFGLKGERGNQSLEY